VIVEPQVPSVDMAWDAVDVELAFEDVFEDDVDFVEEVVALDEPELEELEPQVPPTGLQPVPQYALVDPHHPAEEQQEPNVEPMQVIVEPQVPSVDMAWDAVDVELAFEDVVDDDFAVDEVGLAVVLELLDEDPQVPAIG
jgi:hypothetical protein